MALDAVAPRSMSVVCLVLAANCALRTRQISTQIPPRGRYRDVDGEATEESERQAEKTNVLTLGVLGFVPVVGLALSVYDVVQRFSAGEWGRFLDWTVLMLWTLLAYQAHILTRATNVRQRYRQSVTAGLSALTILAHHAYTYAALNSRFQVNEVIACTSILLACASFPSRPVVLHRGNRILHEKGVSVLDWLLFSWGLHPDHAKLPEALTFADLPRVAYAQSARGTKRRYHDQGGTRPLWRQLTDAFLGPLILQWTMVFLEAASEFGIRFAMHRLLQHLETASMRDTWTWIWVATVAACQLGEAIGDNWGPWIGHTKLQLPMLGLIQSLLVEKMMRLKAQDEYSGNDRRKQPAGPDVMELLARDSTIISQTFHGSHEFPLSCFKLCLNVAYLSSLLGFEAILVGAILPVAAVLLTRTLARRYQELDTKEEKAKQKTDSLISEALHGLRQIRLSSMERFWQGRLFDARDQHQDTMWSTSLQYEFMNLVANLGPMLFSSAAISFFAYRTGSLSPAVAFTAINMFGNLHVVIRQLPHRYADIFKSQRSFQRIEEYLQLPEQAQDAIASDSISLKDASLAWPGHELEPVLKNVDLSFPKNELSLVVGKVGSGKSLILAGILNEAVVTSGQLERPQATPSAEIEKQTLIPGSTAYVSQPPWIEDVTIKENIIFGYQFDNARYQKVLDACALRHDLDTMADGELTTAGIGGSTLSGGQKWRVALARALYSPAEIVVMEDILGAVDAPIARHICANALQGELAQGRTLILATHHPDYCLASTGYLVSVENGTATGTVQPTAQSISGLDNTSQKESAPATTPSNNVTPDKEAAPFEPKKPKAQTVNAQNYWRILLVYIQTSHNVQGYFIGILVAIVQRLLSAGHSQWLARWTSEDGTTQQQSTMRNIAVYLGISVAASVTATAKTLLFTSIGHSSSKVLFERLVKRVLSAKLSWIDSTSPGQVVQTLRSDMYAINHRMAPQLIGIASSVIQIVFIYTTSLPSSPYLITAAVALLLLYIHIALRSLEVASKLRPLVSSYFFPLSDYVQSARKGLTTIRAFGRVPAYVEGMQDFIDIETTTCAHLALGLCWLGIRLSLVGAAFVTAVTAALVYNGADAASTGFTITLALQLRQALSITIGQVNVVRTGFNAVDRVLALADVPAESSGGTAPDEIWPAQGTISVQNLTVSHDRSLPAALSDVSFQLSRGQRLGVIGRTGAGKSTLMSAMLRFVEADSGRILIDGVDISKLPLQRVREAITIIPQDPFLFSGTLRSNIDLYGAHSDATLLSVLRRVHFLPDEETSKTADGSVALDLDMAISSGGTNLSHGQRQLVCLARVMLEDKCRILILDEATSGIDAVTETAIQRAIRESFADTTILVVAHKLLTVADFDSLLVLSQGQVVESGTPEALLGLGGRFSDMVERSGDGDKIRGVISGQYIDN